MIKKIIYIIIFIISCCLLFGCDYIGKGNSEKIIYYVKIHNVNEIVPLQNKMYNFLTNNNFVIEHMYVNPLKSIDAAYIYIMAIKREEK